MIGGLKAEREKVREKRDNIYIIFQALAKTGARNGEQESGAGAGNRIQAP